MNHEPNKPRPAETGVTNPVEVPVTVDRAAFQTELDALRIREKAHTQLEIARIGVIEPRWSPS
jgi:hypothetical protein